MVTCNFYTDSSGLYFEPGTTKICVAHSYTYARDQKNDAAKTLQSYFQPSLPQVHAVQISAVQITIIFFYVIATAVCENPTCIDYVLDCFKQPNLN